MSPLEAQANAAASDALANRGALVASPRLSPEQRLALSREKMRAALTRKRAPEAERSSRRARRDMWRGMRRMLGQLPFSELASSGAVHWWRHHPWRATVEFALDAADEVVRPAADKHPWLLLGGALVAGAVIAKLRPWRSLSGVLLAGLVPTWASLMQWATSMVRGAPDDPEAAPQHDPDRAQATAGGAVPTSAAPAPAPTPASTPSPAPATARSDAAAPTATAPAPDATRPARSATA